MEETTTDNALWSAAQIRGFVKGASDEAGTAWSMLGPRFQHALIVEAAYRVATMQSGTLPVTALRTLRAAMLEEAGL